MAEKLSKKASGRSHVRWARRILARIDAHQKYNYLLTPPQKDALATERATLESRVTTLANAVTPYRAFVDDAYIEVRAAQTVADYLCDEAQRQAHAHLQPRRKEVDTLFRAQGGFSAIFSHKPLSRVLRAGREATQTMARMASLLLASIPPSIADTQAVAANLLKAADLLKSFLDQEQTTIDPQRVPLKLAVDTAVYNLRETLEQIDGRLRTHFSEAFIDTLYPELKKGGTALAGEEDEDEEEPGEPTSPPGN